MAIVDFQNGMAILDILIELAFLPRHTCQLKVERWQLFCISLVLLVVSIAFFSLPVAADLRSKHAKSLMP